MNISSIDNDIGNENLTLGQPDLGLILEKVLHRECMCISEIAKNLNVSRRTVYNWFGMKNLDLEIIYKIGNVTGYDFSKDIPGFDKMKQAFEEKAIKQSLILDEEDSNAVHYWMEKYISLLEKYNNIILKDYGKLNDKEMR